MEPSGTIGLDQCFIPVKLIWGSRYVEFINTEFSIWKKNILKLIKKKNFSVGTNKQQRHLLLSSTGQDFKNQGESFRISKKRKHEFFIFLKSRYGVAGRGWGQIWPFWLVGVKHTKIYETKPWERDLDWILQRSGYFPHTSIDCGRKIR